MKDELYTDETDKLIYTLKLHALRQCEQIDIFAWKKSDCEGCFIKDICAINGKNSIDDKVLEDLFK